LLASSLEIRAAMLVSKSSAHQHDPRVAVSHHHLPGFTCLKNVKILRLRLEKYSRAEV
jgi:lipoprotein-releasing system ATP-binding protein